MGLLKSPIGLILFLLVTLVLTVFTLKFLWGKKDTILNKVGLGGGKDE